MDPTFWRGKRVLITGGTGFIGSHLTDRLIESGAVLTVASRTGRSKLHHGTADPARVEHLQGDLRDREFAERCVRHQEMVCHFASKIAGLAYNRAHPAVMLSYNAMLDLQILDAAARGGVRSFFYPSGALVYDHDARAPLAEHSSVRGDPVAACKGAAWAKRWIERAIPFYEEEYGMRAVIARFSNLYGPGDDFEPETAHLIGNTIRLVASDQAPEIWGDGSQLRSYLYVSSAVDAILLLCEKGVTSGPINIGGQVEYAVRDIIDLIVRISGKRLQPVFRPGGPTGLDRKLLDVTRLRELCGFEEDVSLEEGLRRTYDWYVNRRRG